MHWVGGGVVKRLAPVARTAQRFALLDGHPIKPLVVVTENSRVSDADKVIAGLPVVNDLPLCVKARIAERTL